jgi:murein DD-endopeptidase MepM/ murein hydrolase activator NlpD
VKSFKLEVLKRIKRHNNKTVILLSDDKIYSLRLNPFFQAFLIFSAVILSSFLTYHITIYIKSQGNIQERDHKIFLGETINKNLSNYLRFVIEEINEINNSLNEIGVHKDKSKDKKEKTQTEIPAKIVTEEDFDFAKDQIKKTVLNLDKTIDKRINQMTKALHYAEIGEVLKRKHIFNYQDYKNHNLITQNINYSAQEIASSALSEAKFKLEYMKIVQDFIEKLPTATPIKGVRITSSYGVRFHPILRGNIFHHGIDFKGFPNAPVHATADAKVKFAGWSNSFGNVIILDHGNDIITIYAHLSALRVRNGQVIKKNDIIGLQGSTGRSSGEHLHYEVRYKGKSINPVKFLQINEIIKKNNS